MEQHPVPQNISSYEFRLVGDMTLKQFFQLAGGVLVGIIFYQLPIAGIFKYPLVFVAVITGVLSAFVPFQGRPFNQWLVAFFRAIYSPTEYVWSPTPVNMAPPVDTTTVNTITSAKSQSQIFTGFSSFFASILSQKSPQKIETTPNVVLSQPKDEVGSFIKEPTPIPIIPTPIPELEIIKPTTPTITPYSVASIVPPKPEVKINPPPIQPQPSNTQTPTSTPIDSPKPEAKAVLKSVSFPGLPNIVPPTSTPAPATKATPATPVTMPTIPNVLAGIVTDSQNMAISGATVEIIDNHTGIPARALRTNRLGQFQIAIPLPVGSYIINTEKTGFVFEPVSVQVQNAIIDPIIVKSQNI
jgi:hypothetical protein